MTPQGARFVLDHVAMPALRFERGVTARVVAAIPASALGFRPCPDTRSAAELAQHFVHAELRYLEGAATGTFPDRVDTGAGDVDMMALAAAYARRAESLTHELQAATGDHLLRQLSYRGLFSLPALGFVQLALNHTIHHRGQLSVYLRAMGVSVPPIYG